MKGNREMKLPGIDNLKSMSASVSDLEDEVNQLNHRKRQLALTRNSIQDQINIKLKEIEKRKEQEENNR